MSRCFPFPPPGYERKARNNEEDLLEKEKHREKKHKKDKKDKDKREGKEKKEKDRSDGKHREKKDKKEKHKDKDKDKKRDKEKDGDKTKDKTKASDEKRLSGKSESHGGEKLIQKDVRDKDNSVDKKFSGKIGGNKAEKLTQNSNGDDESKVVQEFARRTKDEATGTGNKFESFSVADRKKDEGMVRLVAKDTSTLAAGMEVKRADHKTTDGQGTRDGTRPGGNAMVQNTTGMVQTKVEALPRLLDKNADTKMGGGNEKTKDKESDDKRGVKRKDKDREKKSHGKDKDRDKDKKKEDRQKRREEKQRKKEEKQKKREDKEKKKEEKEKAKEKIQPKTTELDTLRESNKHNLNNHTTKTPQLPNDSNNCVTISGTPKKRKDFETNGVTHAHDSLPGKLPRPASSSYSSRENGRILEPCQISTDATDRKGASNSLKMDNKDKSDRKGAFNNLKMDNKDRKINGVIETHSLSNSTMKLKSAKAVADPIAEASVRPPDPEARPTSAPHMKLKSATAVADPIAEALVKPLHPEARPLSASPKKPKSATVAADPIAETLARPPHAEAKPVSVSPMKPKSATTAPVDPVAEALARPPHPDSKYISQIYSVPNMEEWSDHGDEEWLFDSMASEPKKAKVKPSTVEETPQVWSEAQQIESADIFALPYVIPY
ncbi:uncharacterized protein LOC133819829 [Humulus lupulus]|uniref:uncharacterized protein LOC133819829 n=1 Tax=Humulus lupulus TaxID=3486 RepID=UPI002B40C2D3|nr:uncharacterized protein LOC133819829 [Humulus lupulus]